MIFVDFCMSIAAVCDSKNKTSIIQKETNFC